MAFYFIIDYFIINYIENTVYLALAFISSFLVHGVLTPYLVILIRDYGYSHSALGLLLALCEAMAITSPFVMGFFADRFRQYRPILLISLFSSLICGAILFLSRNLVFCAIILPVLAFSYRAILPLLDAISTIKLGKEGNYGKYRALGSLTFFVTVLFLQYTPVFVPDTASNIAFWVIAASLVSIVLMFMVPAQYFVSYDSPVALPAQSAQSIQNENVSNVRMHGAVQRHSASYRLWSPLFIMGFSIIFLNRLAMSPINNFLSLFVVEHLKWNAVGLMWALSSGSEIIFIFISKRLLSRFRALPLMAFATSVIILRYIIILLFPTNAGIIVSQLTHSICFGVFHPAAVSFITSCVSPAQRALGMSLYLSLGTGLPTLIGNLAGGFIVEYSGYTTLFVSFSLFAVLGLGLYLITRKYTLRLSIENGG
ncbi:MAG: MFS transporter [Spirochaetaceae bacterium]|jgi:PPP family 3-phenylpropionic acid transporter|nr:MFS transporter [Spirochaetaceae bacterium]